MNEQEFRSALRQSMAVAPAPPPMSDIPVLDAARRDLRRRRMMLAGVGSAAAVVVIVTGVAVLVPSPTEGDGIQVGQTQSSPPPSSQSSYPGVVDDGTVPTSGPHCDRSVTLLAALSEFVPAGYTAPNELKWHEATRASLDDTSDDAEQMWMYAAIVPLSMGEDVGMLNARVYTPGAGQIARTSGCDMIPVLSPTCEVVTVDGKDVVVSGIAENGGQWAVYRYDNGTTVVMRQELSHYQLEKQLPALALTGEQLAAIAANASLNVV